MKKRERESERETQLTIYKKIEKRRKENRDSITAVWIIYKETSKCT